jgi:hypothetical protein
VVEVADVVVVAERLLVTVDVPVHVVVAKEVVLLTEVLVGVVSLEWVTLRVLELLVCVPVVRVVVDTAVKVTRAMTVSSTLVQASVSGLAAWMASIVVKQKLQIRCMQS